MASATLRYARLKPQKTRLVADMVRGQSLAKAREILLFSTQVSAKVILRLIESAKANTLNEDSTLDEEDLFVREIQVNEGPRLKRVRPRSRGMANPIIKRMAHITVTVAERR